MGKIVLLENTGLLKIRIEKILERYAIRPLEVMSDKLINLKKLDLLFDQVDMLMMDYDNCMNADQLLNGIRSGQSTRLLPVIVMTKLSEAAQIAQIAQKGASDIIIKPFDDATLIEKIYRLKKAPTFESVLQKPTKPVDDAELDTLPPWTSDFIIGIDDIDREHQQIFDRFRQLYQVMREGSGHEYYKGLIDFLKDYASTHFEHEELIQKALGYDRLEEHRLLHEGFRQHISNIIATAGEKASNQELVRINLYLKDWLVRHILVEDKRIGHFVKDNGLTVAGINTLKR